MAIPCILFAKEPIPGKVKTRLQPPLNAGQAASLYKAFIRDTIQKVQQTSGLDIKIAFTPDSASSTFSDLGPGIDILPQGPGDLGQKLKNVIQNVLRDAPEGLIVLGCDHPALTSDSLALLGQSLGETSVCFLPTEDGGYAGVALKQPFPILFEDIPWSTPEVMSVTLRICRDQGISTRVMNPTYDVDRPEDLNRMIEEVRAGSPHVGEATKKALKELTLL